MAKKKAPQREAPIQLRLPPDLKAEIDALAERQRRTRHSLIVEVLQEALRPGLMKDKARSRNYGVDIVTQLFIHRMEKALRVVGPGAPSPLILAVIRGGLVEICNQLGAEPADKGSDELGKRLADEMLQHVHAVKTKPIEELSAEEKGLLLAYMVIVKSREGENE